MNDQFLGQNSNYSNKREGREGGEGGQHTATAGGGEGSRGERQTSEHVHDEVNIGSELPNLIEAGDDGDVDVLVSVHLRD